MALMLNAADAVFNLLSDGRWYELDELESRLQLRRPVVTSVVHFLRRFGFANVSDDRRWVRVGDAWWFPKAPRASRNREKRRLQLLLELLGLQGAAVDIYIELLGSGPRTDREICDMLNTSLPTVRAALKRLTTKGLVNTVAQSPALYAPVELSVVTERDLHSVVNNIIAGYGHL